MQPHTKTVVNPDLQKQLLQENRAFLEAVKKRLPLSEILNQYNKVKDIFDIMAIQPKELKHKGE
jgi:hypothetical protein